MGLSWQQGPLSGASVGRFLTPVPLPERLLYVEPLRRRLRVKLGGEWIADSEDVLLFHEPGRYPIAFFPASGIRAGVLVGENRTTQHRDLGDTQWFTVTVGDRRATHGAWQFTAVPTYAEELRDRVAFAWRAMDAFYEEDDRIVGHASDAYHRIDIRQSSRRLVVKDGATLIADTRRPVVLYESGFAPRWYVPRQDIGEKALIPAEGQTFCPYKGLASYYDIGDHKKAAWSYLRAWPEVARISNLVSFEPDKIEVFLDEKRLALEPGQAVVEHGIDRGLDPDEILNRCRRAAMSSNDASVVLVHGAWADGSSWSKIIRPLAADGFKVVAAPLPLTSFQDDVAALDRAIERAPGPVILAGHAYAGAVIGATRSDKVKALVYVAALAPDESETVADVFYRSQPHPQAPQLAPDSHGLIYLPDAAFAAAFAQNAAAEELAVLAAVQRPISPACITVAVPRPRWKDLPSWFLVAEQDRMIVHANQLFMAERMQARVRSHAVDHTPMVTAPTVVLQVLREAIGVA